MPRGEARIALDLVDDRTIILFVGNLLVAKGVRELADAILSQPDRFLGVFLGDGPELGYGTERVGVANACSIGVRDRMTKSRDTCRRPMCLSCRPIARAFPPSSWRPDQLDSPSSPQLWAVCQNCWGATGEPCWVRSPLAPSPMPSISSWRAH